MSFTLEHRFLISKQPYVYLWFHIHLRIKTSGDYDTWLDQGLFLTRSLCIS